MVLFYSHDEVDGVWVYGGTVWQREHVFPCNLGDFKRDSTKDSIAWDIFNVRPADSKVNNVRSDRLYGNVDNPSQVISKNGTISGWIDGNYFEAQDWSKGDCARGCMYVAVAYYHEVYNAKGFNLPININLVFKDHQTLLEWNNIDEVDALEEQRNKVGQSYQGNRNIFIDFPDIINIIFG